MIDIPVGAAPGAGGGARRFDVALQAVLLATAALVAALPWLRAYSSQGARWGLLAAAPASVLVSACASRVLRSGFPVAAASSIGALAITLFSVSGLHVAALTSGLVHGAGRLLTETLPLGGDSVAAPAMVVVWIAGAASSEVALRPPPYSRLRGLAFAMPVLSFVLGVAATARAPGDSWLAAPLLLVVLAAAALSVQRSTRDIRRPHRAIGLSALAAVALAAGIPAIPGFRDQAAGVFEPPPIRSALLVDPVAAFGSLRDTRNPQRPRVVMRVTTNSASDGYLTAAVLDHYDGSEWTFVSTFKPTGGRVPIPRGYRVPAIGGATTVASTTLLSPLPVELLPVLERPTRIDGVSVAADAISGMITPDQRLEFPSRYRSVSDAPLVTLAGVPSADGIEAPPWPSAGDLQLPADSSSAVGTAARFLASITGQRPAPTVEFLQQALAAIRHDETRLDPTVGPAAGSGSRPGAPSGSGAWGTSLSQVINAVTVNRSATPEQFATFFALVARYLGVPARIATGFRLQQAASGVVAAGSYAVSAGEAWTWVEVPVSGMGWVVADPTPPVVTGAAAPPPEQVQAPPTTLPARTANAVPRNQAAGGHAIAKRVAVRHPRRHGLAGWQIGVIAAGSIFAALLGGIGAGATARRRRRRRRFTRDPASLAGGAWLELLDALSRAGMDIPDASTTTEVAIDAGLFFGAGIPERVSFVGTTADRAMCSLLDPPDMETALAAWDAQRQLVRDVHRFLDHRQRARMYLPFRRRGGSRW